MTHRIAPPPRMPEFQVECEYLNGFIMLWKLREASLSDPTLGELDLNFLALWEVHRRALNKWHSPIWHRRETVIDCGQFVDEVVRDWTLQLSGKEPEQPLDTDRLEALQNYHRRLRDIPGDAMEIKH